MIKKTVHIILSGLLLVSTMGVSLSLHYCGGNLKSTSIALEVKACCDNNGGCCHTDTIRLVEVKDNFLVASSNELDKLTEIDIPYTRTDFLREYTICREAHMHVTYTTFPPPPLLQTNIASLETFRC